MKNYIKQLWQRIIESDNQPFIDKIDDLKEVIKKRDESVKILLGDAFKAQDDLLRVKTEYVKSQQQLSAVTQEFFVAEQTLDKLTIHSSLANFKKHVESIKAVPVYYNYGTGRKQPHTIFKESIKDEEIIRDFTKNDLIFDGSVFANADAMVIAFCKKFSSKFPTIKYYKFDKDLYGVAELWKKAKETITVIRSKGVYGDCDDVMTLKYSCLYYLLKDYFPNELWRLRGFIVDLWTSTGHAMLGWVKDGANDWVPIETTFYDNKQWDVWIQNYTIGSQMLYQIRYSFDEKAEYVKI